MPNINTHNVFEIAKKVKVFLNLEAGVTRGRVPGGDSPDDPLVSKMERLQRELEISRRENARLSGRLVLRDTKKEDAGSVEPSRIVWSFGCGRTGSSWLNAMLREPADHANWGEPLVGKLFSDLYYSQPGEFNRDNEHFILGEPTREVWTKSIRNFVLDSVNSRYPGLSSGGMLMVNEPNGSMGAPLIMSAFPDSRMILLVRDPRDIVASFLDASRKGSWLNKQNANDSLADKDPDAFVGSRAHEISKHLSHAKEAYDAHEGKKVMVRYEDLNANASDEIKRIYTNLEIPFDEEEQNKIADKWSWQNLPEKNKGKGKFFRKGKAGGWREDLTRKQVGLVEREAARILREFYPA